LKKAFISKKFRKIQLPLFCCRFYLTDVKTGKKDKIYCCGEGPRQEIGGSGNAS